MADNGVAGARSRSSEVVLSPGVRPGVFWGRMRAVLRYAGSCLVFKYEFVAPDPRIPKDTLFPSDPRGVGRYTPPQAALFLRRWG